MSLGRAVSIFGMVLFASLMFMNTALAESKPSSSPAAEKSVLKKSHSKLSAPAPELYAEEPVPLTPVQCGQCHSSIYRDIKNDGQRHQLQCEYCHTRYHAFNYTKQNWDQLMPKCTQCHVLPHQGNNLTDCSGCHDNPHAPKKMSMSKLLVGSCNTCHSQPVQLLQKNPSAHSKLQCQNCHTSHGYIPRCNACHRPHYDGQPFATCAAECHPVHTPLLISFKKDVNSRTCGACHEEIFSKAGKSSSKHARVSCASCHHTKHGFIPACAECHNQPHSQGLHQNYPKCLTCHQDPHDLPVKQRSK